MTSRIARLPSGRRLAVLLTTLLLAQLATFTGAAPAQAATCTSRVHEGAVLDRQVSPTVKAGYDFAPQCSDGTARVWGYVTDPLCGDNRASQLRYWIYDKRADGSWAQIDYRLVTADNGCGNTSTFNHVENSPGSVGWRFRIEIRACSLWNTSCSTPGVLNYYG